MSKPWSSLAVSSQPQKMVILHPSTGVPLKDKEGIESFLMLHSVDDPVADDVRREMFNKVRPQQQQRKGFRAGVTPTMDLDDAIEAQASLLAALTAGWYLVDPSGNPINESVKNENDAPTPYKFTQARAKEIYTAREMTWLREQADEFTSERTNFFKASENS